MSTSTWNPERQLPRLGDSLPCPSPTERVAIDDRAGEVRLRGEKHVAALEKGARMAVELVGIRKVAVISWDASVIHGENVSLQVGDEEKRTVKNDGESNLFFPADYTGDVTVVVRGSSEGEEIGTISVV